MRWFVPTKMPLIKKPTIAVPLFCCDVWLIVKMSQHTLNPANQCHLTEWVNRANWMRVP